MPWLGRLPHVGCGAVVDQLPALRHLEHGPEDREILPDRGGAHLIRSNPLESIEVDLGDLGELHLTEGSQDGSGVCELVRVVGATWSLPDVVPWYSGLSS